MMTTMIATIAVADIGRRTLIRAVRHRPAPGDVPGLRWLDVAPAVGLASKKPPTFRRAVLFAMWDDEQSAHAFTDTHAFAEPFADTGFHAVLRPLRAFGLDRPCGAPPEGNYVMAGESARTNNSNSTRTRARREA